MERSILDGPGCWSAGTSLCLLGSPIETDLFLLAQVEFATPRELLGNEKSFLRALVDESADKDALYAMADQKA